MNRAALLERLREELHLHRIRIGGATVYRWAIIEHGMRLDGGSVMCDDPERCVRIKMEAPSRPLPLE